MTEQEHEGIRVTDKRRIDPDTFEMRTPPEASEIGEVEAESDELEAKVAELTPQPAPFPPPPFLPATPPSP